MARSRLKKRHGGVYSTIDILVATLTFVSTSGVTQTNIPHRFVAEFDKTDVPSTYKLVLKISSAEQPTQYDQVNTWDDGSIRSCVFRAFVPSLTTGASVTWQIYKRPGTYSASAARTTSDITAHDFKITMADVLDSAEAAEGTGAYTCSVNTNIAVAARTRKIATGPICDAWLTQGRAVDDGDASSHAHLYSKHFIEVWTDPTNSAVVYAISHDHMPVTGWRNVASPDGYVYKAKLKDGASTIRSFDAAYTFTSTDISTVNNTIDTTSIQTGQMVRLTNSGGGLPAGTAITINYWARRDATGKIKLYRSHADAYNGGTVVDITTGGTGTHTATVYISHHYHTGWFAQDTDGLEDWTAHEPLIIPAFTAAEKAYIEKTGFALPFDTTANPSSNTSCDHYPGGLCWPAGATSGHIQPSMDSTGGHVSKYLWGDAASRAWLNMSATDQRNARVLGNTFAHISHIWMDETTVSSHECARILTLNNGSDAAGTAYSGMGTPLGSAEYYNYFGGHSANTKVWGYLGALSPLSSETQSHLERGPALISADASHWVQGPYVAYLLTGRRLMLESMYHHAQQSMIQANTANNSRTKTISATTYYGVFGHWQQPRSEHYLAKDIAGAYACAPDADSEKQYFQDLIDRTCQYYVDYIASSDSTMADSGAWIPQSSGYGDQGAFQSHLLSMGYMQMNRLRRTTNSGLVRDHFNKYTKQLADTAFSGDGYWSNVYIIGVKPQRLVNLWKTATHWGAGEGGGGSCTFGASNTITYTGGQSIYTAAANGDKIWFYDVQGAAPAEITYGTEYFIINKSGSTFQISLTSGGSAFAFTNGGQTVGGAFIRTTGSATGFGSSSTEYAQIAQACACFGSAHGLTGMSTVAANLLQRGTDMGSGWLTTDDPRFTFSPTSL